ncbi:DUF1917-domain-containing protein [Aspergillus ellipticus CBS 707.79]|uniref:DUF1917-domain-containing protein n=1 Tax=Aspergillus ellipticus CBS 707.79 TaxID=1448320 RepID=A0A319D907_9EURO|nr:DUF1917-domain-containing protein [Aspergillus ellipticus CBS 707.79]
MATPVFRHASLNAAKNVALPVHWLNRVRLMCRDVSSRSSEDETTRLEALAASYNLQTYWTKIHPYLFSTIYDSLATLKASSPDPNPSTTSSPSPSPLPTTTPTTTTAPDDALHRPNPKPDPDPAPWPRRTPRIIPRASPPVHHALDLPRRAMDLRLRPVPDAPTKRHIPGLVSQGTRALHLYEDEQTSLQHQRDRATGRSKTALTRQLATSRQALEARLFAVARETGVVTGKWMSFVTPDRVDEYWGVVVEGTVRGELGFGAKVATDDGRGGRARLIAIYTRDYKDREDVKRVLVRMGELGLVRKGERPVYYKCDAYTHLDVMGNNPWGLKASLFSSRDVGMDLGLNGIWFGLSAMYFDDSVQCDILRHVERAGKMELPFSQRFGGVVME